MYTCEICQLCVNSIVYVHTYASLRAAVVRVHVCVFVCVRVYVCVEVYVCVKEYVCVEVQLSEFMFVCECLFV